MRKLWDGKLNKIEQIGEIRSLPTYSHQFFFKYIGPFKSSFIVLTAIAVVTAMVGFINTYLISDLLSNILSIDTERLLTFYLPLYLGAKIAYECLTYFTRKYSEAIPQLYTDYSRIAFYRKIIDSNFHRLMGYSNEKIAQLVDRYLRGVTAFLNCWVWQIPFLITTLIIVIIVLAVQNPFILLLNLAYFAIFLWYAFSISGKFGKITKAQSEQFIESDARITDLSFHLTSIKRLLVPDFFSAVAKAETQLKWEVFKDVRDFHAKRWFIQLNIFNLVYTATLFIGLYQVINGQLELGFIVLINWAYSQLWGIVVFAIEYYVALVEQRESSKIVNREFSKTLSYTEKIRLPFPHEWKTIRFNNVVTTFNKSNKENVEVRIPEFTITQGEKIGIIGRSGSGKSTIINLLLGLLDYDGEITVDGKDIRDLEVTRENMCLISSDDHIFNISVKDNVLLGIGENSEQLVNALQNSECDDFVTDYNAVIGDGSTSLSTGQKQRIRIARGLYQDSDFYLLDEMLSGIDKSNKDQIRAKLSELFQDKTAIFISHIQEELMDVDKLYRVDDGVITQLS